MISFLKECAGVWRLFLTLRKGQRRIVFYAEHGGYLPYLDGFIREILSRSRLTICYLTSDPKDPCFSRAQERLKVFYFKQLLPFVILFLDARVLVMTMPDLHRYTIRRSVRGARHIYVFHAMVSTHMIYQFGAFDHYDVLFCTGPHQVAEIRRSEQLYQTPRKELVEIGYPPLDRLLQARASSSAPRRDGVLVAPSWAEGNILESCASELIRSLRDAGFKAIIRPHPEWIRRHPDRLAQLQRDWAGQAEVEWVFGPLTDQTLLEAAALVTDWSGIALEYAFGTERPVLFLDVPRKIHNPRYEELGIVPIEVRLRDRIGKILPVERSAQAGEEVRTLLESPSGYRDRILEERSRSVFRIGSSAQAGAQFLLELCGDV